MPFDFGDLSLLSIGMNPPVVDAKIFWREIPQYVDDYFEMQEHTDFPTLQDRYRIITSGRRDFQLGAGGGLTDPGTGATINVKVRKCWKVKVAKAKTLDGIKEEWNRLHKYV